MAIIPTNDFDESKSIAFFTKNGVVKRTNLSEFKNIRSVGVRAITLDENDELVTAKIATKQAKSLLVMTKKGICIRFDIEEARQIGRSRTFNC